MMRILQTLKADAIQYSFNEPRILPTALYEIYNAIRCIIMQYSSKTKHKWNDVLSDDGDDRNREFGS